MDELLTGKICPYCGKPTEFVDSSVIYGRSYGMIYLQDQSYKQDLEEAYPKYIE